MSGGVITNNRDIKTTNADGNKAFRVVITNPAPEDQPGPTDLTLSNDSVLAGLPAGELVGTLSVTGGVAPLVFSIDQDLGNAFQIINNELQTSRSLDANVEPTLNVSVRCTDSNGKFTTQTFTITVIPVSGFINQKSYQFNGVDSFAIFPGRLHSAGNVAQPQLSIGFWARIDDIGSVQTLFSTFAPGVTGGIQFTTTGQTNAFELLATKTNNNTKRYRYGLPPNFTPSAWNFYGITYLRNTDELDLYINAIERIPSAILTDQSLSSQIFPDNDFYLGRAPAGSQYFEGRIDELFVSPETFEAVDWTLAYNDGAAVNLDNLGRQIDHWYRAEDDIFPVVLDVQGNTNGSETGVVIATDAPTGFANNFSVEFDGSTNYFIGSGVPDLSTPKSFSFWFKRNTPLQTDIMFAFNATTSSSNNTARIYMDNNSAQRIYFRIDSSSGDIIRRWSLQASSLGQWNHIVITASDFTDATTIQLYKNAVLLTPNQSTNSLTTLPTLPDKLAIGAGVTGGSLIDANIDEYSVYDIELSATEVEQIYNLGAPNDLDQLPFFNNVIQWWRFGDKNAQSAVMENQKGDQAVVMIGYDINFYSSDVP